jgi:lysophospholipase L1-like esterase
MKLSLRKLSAVLVLLYLLPTISHAAAKWHNPEEAGFRVVQGQAFYGQERENFYNRFPAKAKGSVREAVWALSQRTAGESIVFSTDADKITVRYQVSRSHAMPHMPATGVTGVDLYTFDRNGKEVYLSGKYQFKDTVTFTYTPIQIEKKPKSHRYTLYLPLYNDVKWMEIGVEDGAEFRFEPVLPAKPIVAYGTSICQGACASRPAMAWTNILQRRLGHEVVNLGFSGNAFMENEVIDLLAEIDAKVYILDAMPNICGFKEPEAIRDTVLNAVRRLRAARPQTPILIADHAGYPNSLANPDAKRKQDNALKMQKAAYQILVEEGVKGLYYLSYDEIAMSLDVTVEGVHMSDYGMVTYADAYEKKLREILNEPVGTIKTMVPVVQQRDPYNWMERHYDIVTESAGQHYSRVLIGDSIMHFWSDTDDASSVNGQQVWDKFEGKSLNMGCGYDRIENVLWRIYHGQLDNFTADKIFLTIGTNNLGSCTNEEIVEGIAHLLAVIKHRRPEAEVFLMGIFPRRDREARIKGLNKLLKETAKEAGVRFDDPGQVFLKKKKIDESLFLDGLHPNVAGYELIAPYYN